MKTLATLAVLATSLWYATTEETTVTWIFIHTGARATDLPPDELTTAMNGHFENMTRMTTAGHLLVAGPLGPPRSDPAHRGIFLIDEADAEKAVEIASSDPSVQAGVFTLEALAFQSSDPLGRIVELDRADLTARAAASPTGEAEWEGRAYTLATIIGAKDVEALLEPLVDEGLVLFRGRLGDEASGRFLVCLDAADARDAHSMLASMNELVDEDIHWLLHGWYASNGLAQLPFVNAHPDAPTFDLRAIEDEDYAKRVMVFGAPIYAAPGVPDRVTLRMAHLLAQYLDPDEDGSPDEGALSTTTLIVNDDTDEAYVDSAVRMALEEAGRKLPESTPDGSYRVD